MMTRAGLWRSTPLACLLLFFVCAQSSTAERRELERLILGSPPDHVVVVVWDGLRPDFVTPQYTPTLYSLAKRGVFFKNHHAAYISTTEVNGTALATGVHPGHSGIQANFEYRPDLNWLTPLATEGLDTIRRGDLLSGNSYIQVPTLAEILHAAGFPTVVAGTKPVVLLHDRAIAKASPAEKQSVTLFKGTTMPRAVLESLVKVNKDKDFPTNVTFPNIVQDEWTTRSLTRGLWKAAVPKYSLLWLSDPDYSQHETGVGSETALAALESADENLAEIINALKEKGVLDRTDLFVTSDHGVSTIQARPKIADILKRGGFNAGSKFENPEAGDVLAVHLGGSIAFHVFERDEAVTRRLIEFLQGTDFAGVIFSLQPAEGTFPLEAVRMDGNGRAPDILVSLRWSEEKNEFNTPGLLMVPGGKKGAGIHGSLSPYDMRNTLIATGPHFKAGFISALPSGNIDLVPTILALFGLGQSHATDGRVLREAFLHGQKVPAKPIEKSREASRDVGLFTWTQHLKWTEVENAIYFDEGNGAPLRK